MNNALVVVLAMIAIIFAFLVVVAIYCFNKWIVPALRTREKTGIYGHVEPSKEGEKKKTTAPVVKIEKGVSMWRPIFFFSTVILLMIVAACFYLHEGPSAVFYDIVHPKNGKTMPLDSSAHPFHPNEAPARAPTLPCKDAWVRQQQKLGDHRNQNIDSFDIEPTPAGCFEEFNYAPSDWNRWEKMFIPGGPDCQAWFWFFGQEHPIGPYGPNGLPDFPVSSPRPWRVSTNCTIKYFRTS